jgi:hypothetical protein
MNTNNKFSNEQILNDELDNVNTNVLDEHEFLNKCYDKINYILGEDFELSWIYDKKELKNKKTLNFLFLNKSQIKNIEKSIWINKKIELLKKNNFIEIENLKISGVGRFIKINIKTIYDYEKEKVLLIKEFANKIKLIDNKINIIKNNNIK